MKGSTRELNIDNIGDRSLFAVGNMLTLRNLSSEQKTSVRNRSPNVAALHPISVELIRLFRERVGTKLEVHDLARRPFAGFHVERSSGTHRGPQPLTFPAGVRIIDPSIHPLETCGNRA